MVRRPSSVSIRSGEAFEQGRLAGPVAPDQSQPVARADEQVEPAEQPAGALDETEIFISEDGGGHGRGEIGADRRRVTPAGWSPARVSGSLQPWRGRSSSMRWRWPSAPGCSNGSNIATSPGPIRPKSTSPCSPPASSRLGIWVGRRLTPAPPAARLRPQRGGDPLARPLPARMRDTGAARHRPVEQGDGADARHLAQHDQDPCRPGLREAGSGAACPGDRKGAVAAAHPLGGSRPNHPFGR